MKAQGFTKETIKSVGMLQRNLPQLKVGDTISLSLRIKEGDKERVQVFQGDILAMHRNGASSTFTVRKIGVHGIAVERIIPLHSPLVKDITILKRGTVRRAKLYYVRSRVGKNARIKEKIMTKEEKEALQNFVIPEIDVQQATK